MKISEIINRSGLDPLMRKKAKKVAKRMDQIKNPKESDPPTGWRSDPHQGPHNGINWR